MPLIIIAAMTKQGHVIGKGNRLPWNIPDDLQRFRQRAPEDVITKGRGTDRGREKRKFYIPQRATHLRLSPQYDLFGGNAGLYCSSYSGVFL